MNKLKNVCINTAAHTLRLIIYTKETLLNFSYNFNSVSDYFRMNFNVVSPHSKIVATFSIGTRVYVNHFINTLRAK
jgi:hypothetical protein